MPPKDFLRKFGGSEGTILKEQAEAGGEEARLILEAARMQAHDGYPDLEELATSFACSPHFVRRTIHKFNRKQALSFRLVHHNHQEGQPSLSRSPQFSGKPPYHFED